MRASPADTAKAARRRLEDCVNKSADFIEVFVGCDQFRSMLHRLGGDPDVIGRDWGALQSELSGNS